MYIIKPVWLTHGGEKKSFEVFSCDVSPDGKRLVTAAADGYVRIWSTEAIYNCANQAYEGPKQLASMSYHSGTIHTVRFSPGGKFLASGADDKYVCIYTLDPNAPKHATFGSNEAPPVEHWPVFRRLIGHESDVQDLGWSHDGTVLVSVGLDSKIAVWSGYTFEKLKTISSHSSHVKGITFDPANKYFATASDDRTIKIFRFTSPTQNYSSHDAVNNFILETTIVQPFVNSPLTTYFRRCSWSPDGLHIAAPNAVNGPAPATAIIVRGTWDGDTTLIGHEAAVEVCAFAPRLYSTTADPQPDANGHLPPNLTVIACGGADRCFSIWSTQSSRPIIAGKEIAEKAISDMRWTPDGLTLFMTALDGSVVCVVFNEKELGYPRPIEENDKSLTKYGTSRKGQGFPETTDALLLEEMSRAGEREGLESRMGALMGDSQPAQTNGATKAPDNSTNDLAGNGSAAPTNGASTPSGQPDQSQAKLERLKNRVEITKDGKKRIRPLLVSSAGGGESSLPQAKLMSAAQSLQSVDAPASVLDLSKPFDGLPKGGIATLLLGNKRKYAQIEGEEESTTEKRVTAASRMNRTPILTNGPDGLVPAQPQPAANGPLPTPEFIRPAVVNPAMSVSQLRLAVPRVRNIIVLGVDPSGKPADASSEVGRARAEFVLEVRNPSAQSLTQRAQDREPARISLSKNGQPAWQDFLPRTVLLATGNKDFWAVADETGSIYLWTPGGRRLNSALVMESQPVRLESYNSWLLSITSIGMCYVWNVATMSSPHPPVSLAPVLDAAVHSLAAHPTGAPAIHHVRLNSEGRIIISLSNGDGYAYSPQMYCWQRLSEVWWAVGSQYWNSTDTSVSNVKAEKTLENGKKIDVSAGVVPWLERNTTAETLLRGRAFFLQRLIKVLMSREGFESFESGVSMAHLENRIAAAMMLGSKDEFRLYLIMYAKRLGMEGLKLKVEELLRTLVGGIVDGDGERTLSSAAISNVVEGRNWQEDSKTICGWTREELLKDVIMVLGKHREMQRSIVPYAKMLNMVGEVNGNGTHEDVDINHFNFVGPTHRRGVTLTQHLPSRCPATLNGRHSSPIFFLISTRISQEHFKLPSPSRIPTPIPSSSMASLGSKPLSTPCVSISDLSQPSTSPPLFHTSSQKDPTIQTIATGEAYARPQRPSKLCNKTFTFAVLAALIIVLVMSLWQQFPTRELAPLLTSQTHASVHIQETPQPATLAMKQRLHDPEDWLRKHSSIDYDAPAHNARNRPRAALISLVRNEELDGILQSMRHLEYLWNRRHNYPWIFFSETSFTDEFRAATTAATASHTSYQLIPYVHWSTPPFINTTLHHDSLTYLGALNVGKGDLLSYRHMCRWNSGFFFLHPALSSYDYYWRVEPDVHFFCHIPYDPFAFMHENDMVYGFNMNILEDARSFPSLWKVTVEFVRAHPEFLHEGADWRWLVEDDDNAGGTGDYNNCQFFSNFEIGSLNFFRSEAYQAYFRFLDEKGGFFYERFGDAPIHTLAVNLFAKKEQTWFFKDIGYQHDAARHCPPDDEEQGRCLCEKTRLDENFYKLVPMESPQKKPPDSCLRLWLGGEWLRKREGWDREIEMMVGGDGYGGYVRE